MNNNNFNNNNVDILRYLYLNSLINYKKKYIIIKNNELII